MYLQALVCGFSLIFHRTLPAPGHLFLLYNPFHCWYLLKFPTALLASAGKLGEAGQLD